MLCSKFKREIHCKHTQKSRFRHYIFHYSAPIFNYTKPQKMFYQEKVRETHFFNPILYLKNISIKLIVLLLITLFSTTAIITYVVSWNSTEIYFDIFLWIRGSITKLTYCTLLFINTNVKYYSKYLRIMLRWYHI